MRYHLQAEKIKNAFEYLTSKAESNPLVSIERWGVKFPSDESRGMLNKVNDVLSMDENQIILTYGRDPFGLNKFGDNLSEFFDNGL